MFPIVLMLSDRLCVVVGGGRVGRRKARALLRAGARVRLVCLEPPAADMRAPKLEWLQESYQPKHLEGATLVLAAATEEVNRRVAADARRAGVWVNVADDPEACDFHVPATIRRGGFTVAVSTGGAAPGLAHEVRSVLEEQFDEHFGQWVALLAELRPMVLAQFTDAERRRTVLGRLCQWRWLERLRRDGEEAVRAAMGAEIERLERGV